MIFFLVGWALQFLGHFFEGKRPAFLKNITHLFSGVAWYFRSLISLKPIAVTLVSWLALVVCLFFLRLGVFAEASHEVPAGVGLVEGQLRPCPETPNCFATSVVVKNQEGGDIIDWVSVVEANGGQLINTRNRYWHFTFKTGLFGYVDDLEVLQVSANEFKFRSASRVGYSDLGANQKRVSKIVGELASPSL